MLVMPEPPQLSKDEKMITFLEAFNDESGKIRGRYIRQQAIKNPAFPSLWGGISMVPSMELPINFATLKFESDKAHYLKTGELPEDY